MRLITKHIFSSIFSICILAMSTLVVYDAFPSTVTHIKENYRPLTEPAEFDFLYNIVEDTAYQGSRFRYDVRGCYSGLQVLLQKLETRNFSYIKDEEGFLHRGSFYRSLNMDVMSYAKRIARLKEAVSPSHTPVLFVAAPDRYDYRKAPIPSGYPVDVISPRNMDELLLDLRFLLVDTLDLRYSSLAAWPREDLFYRTDSRWTTQAAFEAFRTIVTELEEKHNLSLDPRKFYRNPENYRVITYPQHFLGNFGKSTGIPFSGGLEDFSFALPNFETSFQVRSGSWRAEGPFDASVINMKHLAEPDPRKSSNLLNIYLDGERSAYDIRNLSLADAPRILIIGDSFFIPVAAYLAPACSQVTMLSISADTPEDIEEHVLEHQYDCIIIAYNSASIKDEAFPYFKS